MTTSLLLSRNQYIQIHKQPSVKNEVYLCLFRFASFCRERGKFTKADILTFDIFYKNCFAFCKLYTLTTGHVAAFL